MSDSAAIFWAVFGALTAVALAATAGWLIGTVFSRVRQMTTRRSGPLLWLAGRSRPFWIIVMTAPMIYGVSFGPACWISSQAQPGGEFVNATYPHFVWMMWNNSSLGSLLWRYVTVGHASGDNPVVNLDTNGKPRMSFHER